MWKTRRVPNLPVVPPAERARIAGLQASPAVHARELARLPFADALEVAPPPRPAHADPPLELEVVAWNAERCRDVAAAARLLETSGAELFLLSELDVGMARSGQRHTVRELAQRLGAGFAFGVEFLELGLGSESERAALPADARNDIGYHGGAILSRRPLLDPVLVRLGAGGAWFGPERGERRVGERIAVLGGVELASGPIALASVHLESHGTPAERADQLTEVIAALDRYAPGVPALIAGDTNPHSLGPEHLADPERLRQALADDPRRFEVPWPHEPQFARAEQAGFDWRGCNDLETSTQRRADRSGGSRRGRLHLDWFFARGLRSEAPRVIEASDDAGRALSDHEAIALRVARLDAGAARSLRADDRRTRR